LKWRERRRKKERKKEKRERKGERKKRKERSLICGLGFNLRNAER
jgi:hypothetical protein